MSLILVLHFLKDDGAKLDLLRQIAQRLEDGATFIMLDITGVDAQFDINLELLRSHLPSSIGKEEIDNRIERIRSQIHHVSEQRIEELMIEAGFKDPHCFFQSTIYKGWIAWRSL